MDYNFTANVEEKFDAIAEGSENWHRMLKDFYKHFEPTVEKTMKARSEHKAGERILGTEPKSGKPVSVKIGRYGPVVQIGSAEDKEKPRFAQMPKEYSLETITLEDALDLGWDILAECFDPVETGMKTSLIEERWPNRDALN